MPRGLSDLQKKILVVLKDGKTIERGHISPLIHGDNPTRTQIVHLSKSIRLLHDRGLLDRYCWGWHTRDVIEGFYTCDGYGKSSEIQISLRGTAYLRGKKLPPLVTILKRSPNKCWCGEKLPVPGVKKKGIRHKLLPRKWKIEISD